MGCRSQCSTICVFESKCVSLCGSWLYWLRVLPSRAWFNAAFVNVGQNSLWTPLSHPLCLFPPLFLLLYLSLTSLLLASCTSLLPHCIFSQNAYQSSPIYLSIHPPHPTPVLLFLFITANYISTFLSFTLLPMPLTLVLSPSPILKGLSIFYHQQSSSCLFYPPSPPLSTHPCQKYFFIMENILPQYSSSLSSFHSAEILGTKNVQYYRNICCFLLQVSVRQLKNA